MLMNQLSPLNDIYDEILTDDYLNDNEQNDLEEVIINIIIDFISCNPRAIAEEDFYGILEQHIEEQLSVINENFSINEVLENEIEEFINKCIESYFYIGEVPRSYSSTFTNKIINISDIRIKLEYLRNVPQPIQRTKEWYERRYQLLTASNVYKAFESDSMRNQLIYEKCKPLVVEESKEIKFVNTESTLHWGQKFEPVSVMIYEDMYQTKIEEFGCIPHSKYTFLGASPDGINICEASGRFGRMLEIKNIVNREITGIPKKEYWIQMQQQMEVCDLDECDFLETKFTEISVNDFDTCIANYKGIIMYFNKNTGEPKYIYMPLHIKEKHDIDQWLKMQIQSISKEDYTWVSNIYWKLEKLSCVLVPRNRTWFNANVQTLIDLWEIITKERKTGYDHRQPKKKEKKSDSIIEEPLVGSGCLIKINKDTNLVSLN